MGKRTEAERELETKLRGVMEFYVSTYFEHYSQQIKDEVAKHNVFVETDIMEARIDSYVKTLVEESSTKFHDVCQLILDFVISGREEKVREFEVLFVDLIKRTLVKDVQENKRVAPIVIISDPGVNAKEN
jgi:hypothetical protein